MGLAKCENHAELDAVWACEDCEKAFCARCVKIDSSDGLPTRKCAACGGDIRPVTDESGRLLPKAYLAALPSVLAYPFRGNGKYMLAVTTAFFGLLDFAKAHVPIIVPISFIIAGLYAVILYAYMVEIVRSSANGDTEPPPWPERILHNAWLVLITVVVCLGPVLLVASVLGLSEDETDQPAPVWIMYACFYAGLFLLPMAFLSVSLEDSIRGLNPMRIFPSIIRVLPAYLIAVLAVGATYYAVRVISILPQVEGLTGAIAYGLGLYLQLVQMRILGLLYRAQERRLGWY